MSGIFIHHQALALRKNGHDVQVLHYVRRTPFWRQARIRYLEVETIDGVPVRHVWYYWPGYQLFDFGWCAAITRALYEPVRHLLISAPTIVYAQWLLPTTAACVPLGQALRVPVAGVARGYDLAVLARRSNHLRHKLNLVWRKASAVMANGEWAVRHLQELGLDLSLRHLEVVRNVRDLTEYFDKPVLVHKNEALRIVTVAALEEHKGLDLLIKALTTLDGCDFCVEIVGDGSMRSVLEAQVAELGLQDRVLFRGRLSLPDVTKTLARSHVFVLPSRREGVPNALIEAMASALACIVSAVDGMAELITDGLNGLLVPVDDPVALAKAITVFAQDESFRQQCGLQARLHVQAMYSYEENVARLEGVLNEALKKRVAI